MNLVRKIFAGFTSMAMIMMMVAPVATAADYEDMDTSELISVIQSLQATIESLQAQLGEDEGGEETTTGGAIEGIPEDFTFDQALSSGMSNQSVKYLQVVLNSDPDTQLAESGVGSPGNETQYFGSLTTAGVIAFQEKYSQDVLAPYGLTEGTGYVGETTRAKLNELLQTTTDEDEDTGDEDEGDEEAEFTGLKLSLAEETPNEKRVSYNGQGVVYTTIKAEAGQEDVDITGLTMKRTGLGSYNDFQKVYITVGGVRYGSKRTLGSDNKASLNFSSSASKISIPAGESRLINLVADMGASSSDSGRLNALKLTALESNGSITADLPIVGNYQEIVSISSPALNFDYQGSGEDFYLGDENVTVSEFQVENNADEDIEMNGLTLEQVGSVSNDEVTGYALYHDGEKIAGPVNADNQDYVRFELSEALTLEENQDAEFSVEADIEKGRGETVALALEEGSDLEAKGVSNDLNALTSKSGSYSSHLVQSGKLSISESSDNPQAKTVAPGTDGVVLLKSDFVADEETVVIEQLDVNISGNYDALKDLSVYLDGSSVAGPVDPSGSVVSFDTAFEVSGEQVLEIRADVKDGSMGNVSVDIQSGDFAAREVESLTGDDLTSSVYGSADGNTMTITSGSLTLDTEAAYGTQNVVAGVNDYKIGSFVLQAGEAESIDIEKYVIDFAFNGGITVDDISDLRVSESSNVIASPSASDNSFSVSQTLSANDTEKVYVYASINSGVSLEGSDYVETTLKVTGEGDVSSNDFSLSQTGQQINIVDGSFTPALSSGTPDSDLVVAEDTNNPVAEYKFDATNDNYTINSLQFKVNTPKMIDAMTVEGDEVDSFVNGIARFDNLNLPVEKNDDRKVTVFVDWNAIQDTDVSSGNSTDFSLVGYKAVSDTTGNEINKEVLTDLGINGTTISLSGGTDEAYAATTVDISGDGSDDLRLTALSPGTAGNSINFVATSGASLNVATSGDTITVTASDTDSVSDVAYAIDNSEAGDLVDASVLEFKSVATSLDISKSLSGGTDEQAASATTNLTDTSWTMGDVATVEYQSAEIVSFVIDATSEDGVGALYETEINNSSELNATYATDTNVLTITSADAGTTGNGDATFTVSRPGSSATMSAIPTNEDMYIYRSDLTVTTVGGEDYGSDLQDGDNKIMNVTFKANNHNDLTVEDVEIKANDAGLSAGTLDKIRIENDSGETVASSTSPSGETVYNLTEQNSNGETISAGQEKTYRIIAEISGSASGDSLVVNLTDHNGDWTWSDDEDGQGTDVGEAVGYDEIDTSSYTIDR